MQSYSDLPEEIIMNILTRLPAKSVGQCRCVSKSWQTLLTRPNFIHAHLCRTKTAGNQSLFLLSSRGQYFSFASLTDASSFDRMSDDITISTTKLVGCTGRLFGHEYWPHVCGSCDGLLLVDDGGGKMFLLNPVSKEIKEVPQSPFALDPEQSNMVYGFGYDSVRDDYKIVTVCFYDPYISLYTTAQEDLDEPVDFCATMFVDVYSLKTGLWKRVESCPYDHIERNRYPGVFVNGCIHWVGCRNLTSLESLIVSFDLAEEKFREVPLPEAVEGRRLQCNRLGVLGGCLSMIDGPRGVVWVMRQYGVAESWCTFTIDGPCWFRCFLGQEVVVMEKDSKCVVYHLERGMFKAIVIDDSTDRLVVKASFLESLLSPHAVMSHDENERTKEVVSYS